jgi:hypothetical protein
MINVEKVEHKETDKTSIALIAVFGVVIAVVMVLFF